MKTYRIVSALVSLLVGCAGPPIVNNTLKVEVPLTDSAAGAMLLLRASGLSPSGDRVDVSGEVFWGSSDNGTAFFVNDGRLKLLAPGTVSITATYRDEVATRKLVVRSAAVFSDASSRRSTTAMR